MKKIYEFNDTLEALLSMGTDAIEEAEPMSEIISLENKVAIVTGGARGLGLSVVHRLCEAGARVVIADIASEFAEQAVEFFSKRNQDVRYIRTDVRDIQQIQKAVEFTVNAFGKIDILVNDAAYFMQHEFSDITEEDYEAVMDSTIKGTFFFSQAVVREMIKKGTGGKIVNVASVAGLSMETPYGCMATYVASKSGVVGISQSLARELKPHGININCVIPAGMLTPGVMVMDIPDAIREKQENSMQFPIADPDDVARVVFMMTTDIANLMHGSVVVADDGTRLSIPL